MKEGGTDVVERLLNEEKMVTTSDWKGEQEYGRSEVCGRSMDHNVNPDETETEINTVPGSFQ